MYLKLLNINELERGRYILFTEASFMAQVNIEITSVGINEISRSGKVIKNNISTKRFKDYTHFCRWKKGLNLFNESNTYEKKIEIKKLKNIKNPTYQILDSKYTKFLIYKNDKGNVVFDFKKNDILTLKKGLGWNAVDMKKDISFDNAVEFNIEDIRALKPLLKKFASSLSYVSNYEIELIDVNGKVISIYQSSVATEFRLWFRIKDPIINFKNIDFSCNSFLEQISQKEHIHLIDDYPLIQNASGILFPDSIEINGFHARAILETLDLLEVDCEKKSFYIDI
jgi:hypothetical protein